MTVKRLSLSVLFTHDGCPPDDGWVAQCLEYDVAAQGRTIAEAKAAFERVVVMQALMDAHDQTEPFSELGPAPEDAYRAFGHAERLHDRQLIPIPELPAPFILTASAEDLRIAG